MSKKSTKVDELLDEIELLKEMSQTCSEGWKNQRIRRVLEQEKQRAQDELVDLLNQGRRKKRNEPRNVSQTRQGYKESKPGN